MKKKKTEKIRSETLLKNCGANLWSRSRIFGHCKVEQFMRFGRLATM